MAYNIEWHETGVYRTFSGDITGAEVLECTQAIITDQQFDHICYLASDYLAITSADFSMQQADELAKLYISAAKANQHLKVAVLVEDETLDALAALVNFECEQSGVLWEANFFRSSRGVMEWLA